MKKIENVYVLYGATHSRGGRFPSRLLWREWRRPLDLLKQQNTAERMCIHINACQFRLAD